MGKHKQKDEHNLEGTLREFNFSPKGSIEGALIDTKEGLIQINWPPGNSPGGLSKGQSIKAVVTKAHEDEDIPGEHPVFELIAIQGRDEQGGEGPVRVTGVVRRLNYARHGERNGVILDNGDFVHLKPHGMKQTGLEVDQNVEVEGLALSIENGCRAIEATKVNGLVLQKGKSK
jgi:hypothetical protein